MLYNMIIVLIILLTFIYLLLRMFEVKLDVYKDYRNVWHVVLHYTTNNKRITRHIYEK